MDSTDDDERSSHHISNDPDMSDEDHDEDENMFCETLESHQEDQTVVAPATVSASIESLVLLVGSLMEKVTGLENDVLRIGAQVFAQEPMTEIEQDTIATHISDAFSVLMKNRDNIHVKRINSFIICFK